jgi:uncharacterized OB-fold protein
MNPEGSISILRCANCRNSFLPRIGPCPRCGSVKLRPGVIPPLGKVLAATELLSPAEGWTAPHRLVLVELVESVRILGWDPDELPAIEQTVEVRYDGRRFQVCPSPRVK